MLNPWGCDRIALSCRCSFVSVVVGNLQWTSGVLVHFQDLYSNSRPTYQKVRKYSWAIGNVVSSSHWLPNKLDFLTKSVYLNTCRNVLQLEMHVRLMCTIKFHLLTYLMQWKPQNIQADAGGSVGAV